MVRRRFPLLAPRLAMIASIVVPAVSLPQAPTTPAAGAAPAPAAQEPADEADEGRQTKKEKEEQEVQQASATLISQLEKLAGSNTFASGAIDAIKRIVATTRADQEGVYEFVRAIRDPVAAVSCGTDQVCLGFVSDVKRIADEMEAESYSDTLFQNGNLSHQLKVRLPKLIADSTTRLGSANGRTDFQRELKLISERFLGSRRFRAGLGLSLNYLPRVMYRDRWTDDFSPYQTLPEMLNGGDTNQFIVQFGNKSAESLILSADAPYVQIDALFNQLEATETSVDRVRAFDIDGSNREVFARSTVTSTLKPDFEIALRLKPRDLVSGLRRKICDGPYKERQDKGATEVARIRESGTAAEKRRIDRCENYDPARKSVLDRNDFGFGVGLAAFDIANTISTDIRFRTDATTPFDGLPPGETITTTDSRSFNTRFHNIYWTYHISDEFRFSLDLRNYERDTTNDATVDVNDTQVSLTGLWYPTWAW